MMTVADIGQIIEQWAPTWTAWERDHVGLQLGLRSKRISRILIALEITDVVVREATNKNIDLIITHHPPFFRPLHALTDSTPTGRQLLALARKQIAVYSAHTNLDSARDGVSFALGDALGLQSMKFLSPLTDRMCKIVVFVPPSHVDRVASEMSSLGAGIIGNYTSCSFRMNGTGTFEGNKESHPAVGKPGKLERAEEVRLEMIAPTAAVDRVIEAVKRIHPYEEVAIDVFPVVTPSANYGMGVIGTLKHEIPLEEFLRRAKSALHTMQLRYSGDLRSKVKSVAVCGGSGSDLLDVSVKADADVFLTADVRYHTFQEATGRIALVDAGHWETEHLILEPLKKKLLDAARQMHQRLSVSVTKNSTNPIRYI